MILIAAITFPNHSFIGLNKSRLSLTNASLVAKKRNLSTFLQMRTLIFCKLIRRIIINSNTFTQEALFIEQYNHHLTAGSRHKRSHTCDFFCPMIVHL